MTDLLLTPLDRFIRDQQDLTAVDHFSRHHDADALGVDRGGEGQAYRALVPLAMPTAGEQYAFEVDLDACSGCKACVSACHSLNGLDDDETWRSVGLLHGGAAEAPVLQTVTTACHHCVDPACLNGCPVEAYEKDPITGIVAHLDDQCIGCSYCTLMCPYEVPVYDPGRGVVRKCDMCQDRLADGEAPACVQGCPTDAISITIVTTADLVDAARTPSTTGSEPATVPPALVPSAPSSAITVPTTRYVSARPLPPTMVAADRFSLQPSHAHTPLAVMLVLTQLSVGTFVLAMVAGSRLGPARAWTGGVALLVGIVALAASVLHLGRPWLAWRAVLGLRHSWLSREIVAFGLFAAAATADAAARGGDAPPGLVAGLDLAVVVAGVVGVGCSVQIYVVTRRRWWSVGRTGPRFVLSALASGSATLTVLAVLVAAGRPADEWSVVLVGAVRPLAALLVVVTVVGVFRELLVLVPGRRAGADELERTARLLTGDLRSLSTRRLIAAGLGGVVLPLWLVVTAGSGAATVTPTVVAALGSLVLVVAGELAERRLFFLAVSSARMPGMLR